MPRLFAIFGIGALLAGAPSAFGQGLPAMERVHGLTEEAIDLDARGDRWAVVFADGSVRVHDPDGTDWYLRGVRSADGASDDDAVLRVEGLLDDISSAEGDDFDQIEVEDDEDIPDVEEAEDPGDQVEELLQGETTLTEGRIRSSERPILRWGVGERIAVSRADGVWVSDDGGRRWSRLTRRPASALADTGSYWAALLPSGEIWIEGRREVLGLGALGVDVADIAASDGTLWAATELGLWRRAESGWTTTGDDLEAITSLVADPGWEGGLWSLGPIGVRRTNDGGQTWQLLEPGGPVVGEIRYGGPAPGGSLLISTNRGFWQFREGAWNRDPRLARSAVGTEDGLFAIIDGRVFAPPGPALTSDDAPPTWIPLGDLLTSALSRRELSEAMRASRVVQTVMPEVLIEGQYRTGDGIDYLPFTTADTGSEWKVLMRLKWTPAGRSAAGETFDQTVEEIALRTGFDDIGIAGDRGLLGAMGGRVGRRAAGYRSILVTDVTDLYRARNALHFERASVPATTLLDEVSWQLRLEEIEARLDALTDGAVSSWSPDGAE